MGESGANANASLGDEDVEITGAQPAFSIAAIRRTKRDAEKDLPYEALVRMPGVPEQRIALTSSYARQLFYLIKNDFIPRCRLQSQAGRPPQDPLQALLAYQIVGSLIFQQLSAEADGDIPPFGAAEDVLVDSATEDDEMTFQGKLDFDAQHLVGVVFDLFRISSNAEGGKGEEYRLVDGIFDVAKFGRCITEFLLKHGLPDDLDEGCEAWIIKKSNRSKEQRESTQDETANVEDADEEENAEEEDDHDEAVEVELASLSPEIQGRMNGAKVPKRAGPVNVLVGRKKPKLQAPTSQFS